MHSSTLRPWFWAFPTVSLLVAFVVWPLAQLVRLSLNEGGGGQSGFGIGGSFYRPGTWTLDVYRQMLHDAFFWELVQFSVWLALVVTLLCVVLAFPVAHFLWRLPRRWKLWGAAAVVIPKLSSLLVTVYGLKIILSDYGPVNQALLYLQVVDKPLALQHSATGVVISETLLILPYTILIIWVGLERVDRTVIEAARGLGAGAWSAFRRITLPLALPSIAGATLVSLIWALGAFISPYLLGSPQEITLAVDVQRQMFENLHWPRGAAEGVALLLLSGLLTFSFFGLLRSLSLRTGSMS